MIKVINALVAEFTVHGMFRHGNVADPTMLHGFVRTGIRLKFLIEFGVNARKARVGSTIDCHGVLSRLFPMLAQVNIQRIGGDRQYAVVHHERHHTEKDQRDGTGSAFWKNGSNEKEPL